MRHASIPLVIAAFAASCVSATATVAAQEPSGNTRFDGTWLATITCDGYKDAKGYAMSFPVSIRNGVVDGQYGKVSEAASLRYTGTVAPDGTLEIRGQGRTGSPDYALTHPNNGTPYGYRLKGRLEDDKGSATRVDTRPCQASFVRQ